ncbi:MAG: hypothetical protein QOH57_642 [Mycobacterium sp.]|nr:hypothetical protein [Mycobacterium sp.]
MSITEQIASDRAAGRFDSWGLSTVLDEHVGAPVIPRQLFDRLHELAGIGAEWPVGNAGLIHVYGYLLSTVQTPHGLKRERWLDGSLARALALGPAAFLPDSQDGRSLLDRVTEAILPPLQNPPQTATLTLDQPSLDGAMVFRTLIIDNGHGAALLYGVRDGIRMRAITAFPLGSVGPADLDRIAEQEPRLRYNAAAPGLPPRSPLRTPSR